MDVEAQKSDSSAKNKKRKDRRKKKKSKKYDIDPQSAPDIPADREALAALSKEELINLFVTRGRNTTPKSGTNSASTVDPDVHATMKASHVNLAAKVAEQAKEAENQAAENANLRAQLAQRQNTVPMPTQEDMQTPTRPVKSLRSPADSGQAHSAPGTPATPATAHHKKREKLWSSGIPWTGGAPATNTIPNDSDTFGSNGKGPT